jgi:hypothetical protein
MILKVIKFHYKQKGNTKCQQLNQVIDVPTALIAKFGRVITEKPHALYIQVIRDFILTDLHPSNALIK